VSYCTQQDLIDRFGEEELIQLTDRTIPATAIDATVVAAAIGDADNTINGYLVGRYELPLASNSPELVRPASDLARYFLYGNQVTEEVETRKKDAIRYLELVGMGKIKISIDGAVAEAASTSLPEFSSDESAFGRSADW
jgi:phage gp36-like protein